MLNKADADPSMGFTLEFPLGQANEEEGFVDLSNNLPVPADMLKIEVKFPREGFFRSVEPVSDTLRGRFTTARELSLVKVSLRDATLTKVHGFGMPFKNRGHPFEGLLNEGGVIAGKYTLLDIPRQEKFHQLSPPFVYPYGDIHSWDVSRYVKMLDETRGHQFAPAWYYHDDNAHLAAMTQSQVQDVMWLDIAAGEIASKRFLAYFVESAQGDTSRSYVIIALSKRFKDEYESALRRLVQGWGDEATSGEWDAKIIEHRQRIDALKAHPIFEHEMVLRVRRRRLPAETARGPDFRGITFSDHQTANVASKESMDW
ncbi:hypothetical protein ACHAPT_002337 [Fusarium lateritium]